MKIREWIKEQEEHKCPEGQRWCPIQKKCVTPPGKGMGPGKTNEISPTAIKHALSRAVVFALEKSKSFYGVEETNDGFRIKWDPELDWVNFKFAGTSK